MTLIDHWRIVETDNFGGDYPDEKFVNLPYFYDESEAIKMAGEINRLFCDHRFWKVVKMPYKLAPGFEP